MRTSSFDSLGGMPYSLAAARAAPDERTRRPKIVYWLLGLCALFGLLATAEDLWRRKVSNPIALAAFLSGLAAQAALHGFSGVWDSLLGGVIGFAVFLIFFMLGGMGGGDIKLMAGFGAIIGSEQIVTAAIMAALAGGLMALAFIAVHWAKKKFGSDVADSALKSSIPYAPAITAGVLLSFLSRADFLSQG